MARQGAYYDYPHVFLRITIFILRLSPNMLANSLNCPIHSYFRFFREYAIKIVCFVIHRVKNSSMLIITFICLRKHDQLFKLLKLYHISCLLFPRSDQHQFPRLFNLFLKTHINIKIARINGIFMVKPPKPIIYLASKC